MVLPYDQIWPKLAAEPAYAGDRAAVLGQVSLGESAWLGNQSVIRADGHHVRVGRNFHLGPRGTVHIAHDMYPAIIGNDVSAGENAVIHACEIGDKCVLGHGATVLDGSVVEPCTVLAPASVVYPRSRLEGGWLYSGCPAKPVRPLAHEELDGEHARIGSALSATSKSRTEQKWSGSGAGFSAAVNTFVACTAELAGAICAEADVSIWYGCHFDAGLNRIMIGARTNIQDNTIIVCSERDVAIGENVTIGHNASLTDCTIGANSPDRDQCGGIPRYRGRRRRSARSGRSNRARSTTGKRLDVGRPTGPTHHTAQSGQTHHDGTNHSNLPSVCKTVWTGFKRQFGKSGAVRD